MCKPRKSNKPQKSLLWRLSRWAFCLSAVFAVLLGWLLQPVPYRYAIRQNDGTLVDVAESTNGRRIVLGSSSHILPLIRAINVVGEPFKKWLVPLDAALMREKAIALVGHDNFGDLADWEAFDRLVQVAEERCHLFGRLFLKGMLESILATNLKIQQLLQEHPEIESEQVIDRPVILAAFTRTGATFLYQVLADIYETELTPTYSYEIFGGPLELHDPPQRVQIAQGALTFLGYMNPPMKLLHEWIGENEPEDEPGWYQHTLQGLVIPFTIPSDWHHSQIYKPESQTRNRRFWVTMNKIRQWQTGKKARFLLKAPEHLFGLPDLVQSHPDASVISVSRDEETWYPSALVMTQLFQYMSVDARVEDTIAFTDKLLCEQRKSLEIAHNGSYNVLPIKFGSYLFTQTFDVVERIAKYADLSWDEETQERARQVIAKRLSWKKEKVLYKLDDFGMTQDSIAERLGSICE